MATIRIRRNKKIYNSRSDAFSALDSLFIHKGELVELIYKARNEITGTALVLGIADGYGENNYQIITTSAQITVHGITKNGEGSYPDVTDPGLLSGGRFIWQNKLGQVYWIYNVSNNGTVERKFDVIKKGDTYKVYNLEDGLVYEVGWNYITTEGSDYYTREEIDRLLENSGSGGGGSSENFVEMYTWYKLQLPFDTVSKMNSAASACEEGQLAYCKETKKTYILGSDKAWTEFKSGTLISPKYTEGLLVSSEDSDVDFYIPFATEEQDGVLTKEQAKVLNEVQDVILEDEEVTSAALNDLNDRLEDVKSDISVDLQNTENFVTENLLSFEDRIVALENFKDNADTNSIKRTKYDVVIDGPEKLREGQTGTVTTTWSWSWLYDDLNGLYLDKNGTRIYTNTGITKYASGQSVSYNSDISMKDSNISFIAGYIGDDTTETFTVEYLVPSRTSSCSVSTGSSWETYNTGTKDTVSVVFTGSNLPEGSSESISLSGSSLTSFTDRSSDDPFTYTYNTQITSGTSENTYNFIWSYGDSQTTSSSFTVSYLYYLYVPEKNLTAEEILASDSKAGLQRAIVGTAKPSITTNSITYTAGTSAVLLYPKFAYTFGTVKSQSSGSDTWATISGFSESGAITVGGNSYYYISNPNIGAGTFKFQFS